MKKKVLTYVLPIFLFIEIIITLLNYKTALSDYNIVSLTIANTLLLVAGLVTLRMQLSALSNPNPHVFIRSVIGGLIIKMFIFIIGVILYASLSGIEMNNYVVAASIGFYIIYLVAEVSIVLKQNSKKNA